MITETEKMSGIELIAKERAEQIEKHGFDVSMDIEHYKDEQLVNAAYAYLTGNEIYWPWDVLWKPKSRIENLTKAGALIAAEIDRLQNLERIKR